MPPPVERPTGRRRHRRLDFWLVALLLGLVVAPFATTAAMDVPAQLYLLDSLSAPEPPRELSAGLERRLNGTPLADLSAALQRALLWDAGWMRLSDRSSSSSGSASSSSTAAAGVYVQVLVPCGKGMDDVLVPREELETRCSLESKCVRPGGGNSSAWGCASTRDMAEMAQCAIRPPTHRNGSLSGSASSTGRAVEAVVENVSWPAVALASAIDASFDPQLFRFMNTTQDDTRDDADTVLLLAARGSWHADSASFCLQAPLFLTPCRVLASSSGSGSGSDAEDWCEPERLQGVDEWLSLEEAALASTEQTVGGESIASSSSSGDGKHTALLIGVIAAVVVLVTVITVPFFIARRNQHTSRQPPPPSRHRRHQQQRQRQQPSRSADQSLSASDFRLLTDR